jgi:hypothetical protein
MAESPTTAALAGLLVHYKKPLKRLGLSRGVINTQLKQGVNERDHSVLKHIRTRARIIDLQRNARQGLTSFPFRALLWWRACGVLTLQPTRLPLQKKSRESSPLHYRPPASSAT